MLVFKRVLVLILQSVLNTSMIFAASVNYCESATITPKKKNSAIQFFGQRIHVEPTFLYSEIFQKIITLSKWSPSQNV